VAVPSYLTSYVGRDADLRSLRRLSAGRVAAGHARRAGRVGTGCTA